MAMQDEARPVIETLGLAHAGPLAPPLPMQRYSGKADQAEIDLVILGKDSAHGVDCIGTVSAALAAREAIRLLKPDMLLNAGTCGGFVKRGGAIGKVYVSGGPFWFHDRRVPLPGVRGLRPRRLAHRRCRAFGGGVGAGAGGGDHRGQPGHARR